ncbi:SHOCT domain-containing protein [Thalassospiraceae bacterium LMO-JJ14]|nr:SHOCT domain-containing protein [Thalassospiraceae bacterium LMO-JJ14]
MEAIFWLVGLGIVAAIFIPVLVGLEKSSKAKAAGQAIVKRDGFQSDVHYVSPYNQKGLAIDKTNNQILFSDHGHQSVFPFRSLIATEVLEDGVSISSTNRGSQIVGAAVGGVLLGGVGAVIGGLSGSSTTSNRAKKITLRIVTDDFQKPNFDIVMLDFSDSTKGVEKESIIYKQAIEEAAAWHSRLSTILKRLSENDESQMPKLQNVSGKSIADEIEKLATLLEKGLITEEEFKAQKANLLAK